MTTIDIKRSVARPFMKGEADWLRWFMLGMGQLTGVWEQCRRVDTFFMNPLEYKKLQCQAERHR